MNNFCLKQAVVFCPAKINIFFAVTGERDDGYHNLISIVGPLDFGDHLWVYCDSESKEDRLDCDGAELDCGPNNLILKAAKAFRQHYPLPFGLHFVLKKRIPIGAGLGGGSSNATGALRVMNLLAGNPLNLSQLHEIASGIGSDCPLFLHNNTPVIIRGRGEQVTELPQRTINSISGKQVLLFKPNFSISTPWAYSQIKEYDDPTMTEIILNGFTINKSIWIDHMLYNNMQACIFEKYKAFQVLLDYLRTEFNISCQLSGSGSTCFAIINKDCSIEKIKDTIHDAWGEHIFILECRLA
jgi:4-diphosphocytidyl-2-C-methyl-D-erythritol kinase